MSVSVFTAIKRYVCVCVCICPTVSMKGLTSQRFHGFGLPM